MARWHDTSIALSRSAEAIPITLLEAFTTRVLSMNSPEVLSVDFEAVDNIIDMGYRRESDGPHDRSERLEGSTDCCQRQQTKSNETERCGLRNPSGRCEGSHLRHATINRERKARLEIRRVGSDDEHNRRMAGVN